MFAQVPLCVAQLLGVRRFLVRSQLVCLFPSVQTQCVDQRFPPLRDWRPTLIRAPVAGPPRRHLLDGVFNGVCNLASSCARSRRRQPECHQACVARNGAWRDHRRAPLAATRDSFRKARTSFHRVVRRCQNHFWSDWQENLTSLSRVNPPSCSLASPTDVQWSVKT